MSAGVAPAAVAPGPIPPAADASPTPPRRRLTTSADRPDLRAGLAAWQVTVAEALAATAARRDAAEFADAREDAHAWPEDFGDLLPLRVLVVDDLPLLRRIMVRQLAAAGHAVLGDAARRRLPA